MPIAIDPSQLVDVPLACPDGTPAAKRPVLKCRAMSVREHREYRRKVEEAGKATSDEDAFAAYKSALMMSLRGWENVNADDGTPLPFSADALDEFDPIGLRSAAELLPRALTLGHLENFRSPLRLQSGPESSAPAARADGAQTPPATEKKPSSTA